MWPYFNPTRRLPHFFVNGGQPHFFVQLKDGGNTLKKIQIKDNINILINWRLPKFLSVKEYFQKINNNATSNN